LLQEVYTKVIKSQEGKGDLANSTYFSFRASNDCLPGYGGGRPGC